MIETKRATFTGHCSDGKQVKAQDEYPVAHFSQKAATQLNRTLKQQRESIQSKLSINIYESQWWKLRIDGLVTQSNELTEHGIITVLFYFLRRPAKDRVFIDSIKRWLNYVASNLLKRARKQDFLFLAHHALRCPTGFARWVAAYLQTPAYNAIDEDDERNVHHADVVLALLSVVCKPIRDREQFLEVDTDRDQHWVWLDSDGEDDEHTDSLKLTDGDLLLFINQIPLANVFRFAFKLVKRDERDVRTSRLEPSQWLRALAIFRKLIAIISTGLSTYGDQCCRLERTIRLQIPQSLLVRPIVHVEFHLLHAVLDDRVRSGQNGLPIRHVDEQIAVSLRSRAHQSDLEASPLQSCTE